MGASRAHVYILDNYIAQLVAGLDADVHKHGGYQLSISVDGTPHRVGPRKDAQRTALGHLSGPNTPHSLNSGSGQQVLIWIAPQSTLGRHLGSTFVADFTERRICTTPTTRSTTGTTPPRSAAP